MKLTLTALTVAAALTASGASAFDPDDLQKLLDTGNCFECDLTGANLNNAELSEANLNLANLSLASLEGATLTFVKLSGANLSGANLESASLSWATLINANLEALSVCRFASPLCCVPLLQVLNHGP